MGCKILIKTFTNETFLKYRNFIHKEYGIFYSDGKKELLNLKLNRCLAKSGVDSYLEFFTAISSHSNPIYLRHFIDEITVNKTNFFREMQHFDFIKTQKDFILNQNSNIKKSKEIRVWSMACSTGEEPYTLAMVLKETFPDYTIKILATDISHRVLKLAMAGEYASEIETEVEPHYLNKYFINTSGQYTVKKELKQLITFRQFNLINPFVFQGTFELVFCRNVMIYFNLETQCQLLDKVHGCISDGGLLFIGLSESMINKSQKFKHIGSTIYQK